MKDHSVFVFETTAKCTHFKILFAYHITVGGARGGKMLYVLCPNSETMLAYYLEYADTHKGG